MSERSEEALSRLPNKGQPSIGGDGMLREYRGVDASDLPDPGHRHSSGLWALYPGSQVRCKVGGVAFSLEAIIRGSCAVTPFLRFIDIRYCCFSKLLGFFSCWMHASGREWASATLTS